MTLIRTPGIILTTTLLLTGCVTADSLPLSAAVRADALDAPLTAIPGDAVRGREIVTGRDGNCLLCHAIPESGQRFMGNVAPPLTGVSSRLSAGQIRLRVADPTRVNPNAVMPAYHRVHDLDQVALAYRGKPVLDAQQVEDVVAYLSTLH